MKKQIDIEFQMGHFALIFRGRPPYPRLWWSFYRNYLALTPTSGRPAMSWQLKDSSRSRQTCSGGKTLASIST